jgi:D-serine dehydratase
LAGGTAAVAVGCSCGGEAGAVGVWVSFGISGWRMNIEPMYVPCVACGVDGGKGDAAVVYFEIRLVL